MDHKERTLNLNMSRYADSATVGFMIGIVFVIISWSIRDCNVAQERSIGNTIRACHAGNHSEETIRACYEAIGNSAE